MKVTLWSCIAVLFLFVIESECSIRCYVCTTQTGPYADRCGDDFRLTSTSTSYCDGSCQKTRGKRSVGGRDVVEVTRGCVTFTDERCYKGDHSGISADICTCNQELCNSASSMAILKQTGLILGLGSILIKYVFAS